MDDEDDGHDASDDSSLAGPHEAFFGTFSLARIVAEVIDYTWVSSLIL